MTFLNFFQRTKYQFIPLILFWDTANLSVLRPEWPHPFLTKPTTMFFVQLLISVTLHQNAKNQVFSSFYSTDIVDLKILQSDWQRRFWPISQVLDLSQVKDLCKNTANNMSFFIHQIQKKILNKFSNSHSKKIKIQKAIFLAHFWSKTFYFFFKNPALPDTTPHGPLT